MTEYLDKSQIKQQIRARVRNTAVSKNAVFIPAKPKPTINDNEKKNVAVYARVSTLSAEQVSSIENQTKYYTEKIAKTNNWTMQEIYSDEGKSGTSMRKRTEFQRMLQDAKDKKMDLILCASVSRFARNVADCMEQIRTLKTQNPSHPVGVYFETENIYTLDPECNQALGMHAILADWESANKSRRMIISYDQRICMGQYPLADLLGYRHTKDGQLIIHDEEAKTVRFIFLAYISGVPLQEIADILTKKHRPTLRGRTKWNAAMVYNIMTNERRWGDLNVRKRIVIDYVKGTTVKNTEIRDAAFVPGHHKGIVSPEIANAAKLMRESGTKYTGGIPDTAVIQSGALKGFLSISPSWAGVDAQMLTDLCSSIYDNDELNLIQTPPIEMISSFSEYEIPPGVVFIDHMSPTLTITGTKLKFNKMVHKKLGPGKYLEILYHPIFQAIAIRPCDKHIGNTVLWEDENGKLILDVSAKKFCKSIYQNMDWRKEFHFKFRGVTRERNGSKIMLFFLDEPQILLNRNIRNSTITDLSVGYISYKNSDTPSISWKSELPLKQIRQRIIDNITQMDITESGTVVDNPLVGNIPSQKEIKEELTKLLTTM